MRSLRLAFLFLGFLTFIATAAPLANPDLNIHNVENINDEKRSSDAIVYERDVTHEGLQSTSYLVRSVCTSDDKDCDDDYSGELDKRGRVKKPTAKKPATTEGPNTGTNPGTGVRGRKGGKKTPILAQPGKSKDYLVVEAAAKKKGKKLVVGESYLLTEMSPAVISHHKLIVAKVVRKGNQLDVQSTMQQLVLKENERGKCFEFFGGTCKDAPLQAYECSKRVESGKGTFKFSGTAKPEFGDPDHFIAQGNSLLIKNTKYNIITNNCQTFATDLANIGRQTEKPKTS